MKLYSEQANLKDLNSTGNSILELRSSKFLLRGETGGQKKENISTETGETGGQKKENIY